MQAGADLTRGFQHYNPPTHNPSPFGFGVPISTLFTTDSHAASPAGSSRKGKEPLHRYPQTPEPFQIREIRRQETEPSAVTEPQRMPLSTYFSADFAQLLANFLHKRDAMIQLQVTKVDGFPHIKLTHSHSEELPKETEAEPTADPITVNVPASTTNDPANLQKPPNPPQITTPMKTYKRQQRRPRKATPKHLSIPPSPDFGAPPPPPKTQKYKSLSTLKGISSRTPQAQHEVPTTRNTKQRSAIFVGRTTQKNTKHQQTHDMPDPPAPSSECTNLEPAMPSPAWHLSLQDDETDTTAHATLMRDVGQGQHSPLL